VPRINPWISVHVSRLVNSIAAPDRVTSFSQVRASLPRARPPGVALLTTTAYAERLMIAPKKGVGTSGPDLA
jgi:hypothetical protein